MMTSENGALVQFVRDAVQNNYKSAQAGRPVFDEFDFVRIQTPGDTRTSVYRKASEQDKQRFPRAWEAYQKGLEAPEEGTPIDQWPQVSAAQVRELRHVHVRTVENLAALSDGSIQHLGPGYQQLRQQARQYLDAADKNANATALARENDELREQVRLLKEQNEALKAQQALQEDEDGREGDGPDGQPAKRGPGRPRKVEVEGD